MIPIVDRALKQTNKLKKLMTDRIRDRLYIMSHKKLPFLMKFEEIKITELFFG